MRSIISIMIVLLLAVGTAVFFLRQQADVSEPASSTMQNMTTPTQVERSGVSETKPKTVINYDHTAELMDVTSGKVVRGIQISGGVSGVVQSGFENGTYHLFAEFLDLPEPQGGDFYEGWLVRRGANPSVMSTGRVELAKGAWQNTFTAGRDLRDHDLYVLTLEPNDGNPAPADHIFEGVLKQK